MESARFFQSGAFIAQSQVDHVTDPVIQPPKYESLWPGSGDEPSDVATDYGIPTYAPQNDISSILHDYQQAIDYRRFSHEVDDVASQYLTLPWRDIRSRHIRVLGQSLGTVVFKRSSGHSVRHDLEAPVAKSSACPIAFANHVRELLDIGPDPCTKDRERIARYTVQLASTTLFPSQAALDIRLDCDRWKRDIERFRGRWLDQPREEMLKSGRSLEKFLAIWLESLATEKHWIAVRGAVGNVLQWRKAGHTVTISDAAFPNIVGTLVNSYMQSSFSHLSIYRTDAQTSRHAGQLFIEYLDTLRSFMLLWMDTLAEEDALARSRKIFFRLDPCARAIYLYAMLYIAFEEEWGVKTHLELFDNCLSTFTRVEGALNAIALITLKHAELACLRHLYIAICQLGRIKDSSKWMAAWDDVLALVRHEERDVFSRDSTW
ncbi:hypothetical protein LTR78_007425 [Recurvomyces mirabilis]|uniref:Uncharacterized protein n=1 Tax=Recurvomyces mirabilis TaxID=574656 RepID=A0AAE0TVE1_9PEZI|nr:hypothetical protein LTR78_007425 [Recurvomyces mirabilis]KAK5160066.1 hypothetical protein LTS14_002172 [Recurvomyces mirabilis]